MKSPSSFPRLDYQSFLARHPELDADRKIAMATAIVERKAKSLEAAFRLTARSTRTKRG